MLLESLGDNPSMISGRSDKNSLRCCFGRPDLHVNLCRTRSEHRGNANIEMDDVKERASLDKAISLTRTRWPR